MAVTALAAVTAAVAFDAAAAEATPAAIIQDLRSFRELGSVLYVAAHPDDENTQLITYLARGRGYRTAYLSVTRGDGGQNLFGPEFGEKLGVARTQELLAARRLDGGRQFFTRAIDFGFSKTPEETLRIWNREEVLADFVRIIRTFRPDVIVTRFSPRGGGHGHHTASAILAVEAFKLAGDPNAFPDQLKTLKPWQPKRVLQNGGGGLQIRVDGKDPVTGQTFAEIAGRSRAMHKTQGFGNFGGRGGAGPRSESFTLLDGEPASEDIMDGVDTSWARVGAAEIGRMTDEVLEAFDPENPSASVPALLAIHKRLAELPRDPIIDEKRAQLAGIIQACAGLSIETTVPEAEVVPGETLKLRHAAKVRSDVLVRWVAVRYPSVGKELRHVLALEPGREVVRESTQVLPANTKLTQPYWLREDSTVGMFTVNDVSLIGRAENPPVFPVEYEFEIGGERIVLTGEPVQPGSDDAAARRLDVIAPISLNFISDVKVFAPGASKAVEVEILAARPDMNGTVRLEAPAGWKVSPESQPFKLERKGERARVAFTVTAPGAPAEARITARARVNDVWYDNQRVEIRYDHIPLQVLQPPARVKAVSLELATRGREVGYVPGAGDDTVAALKEMGYSVRTLSGEDLTPETLKGLDAVVIGIRAFNTRDDLDGKTAVLSEYVQGGGTVVAQYNNARGLSGIRLGPFEFRLSNNQRVTDEHAPVRFLAADHPALNTPNKITAADFENWVQERGLYFPSGWDEAFTPLLECADPGEEPLKGGLLVAQHGKGCFVYTSLAFFRQLPEGVPGAYRLFANLVSLGK